MNMLYAVKSVLTQFFGFRGRARRSEYWYWILATILVAIVIAIIEALMGMGTDASGPLSTAFNLAIFFPGLAVTFRRLHDIGRTGWWIGGFYLALFIVALFAGLMMAASLGGGGTSSFAAAGASMLLAGLAILIYAIVMLVFLCTDSQHGPNKYGANPKNEGNYDVFG
jgi:uncharacterized membrane protein YhaH (DUF805 family)